MINTDTKAINPSAAKWQEGLQVIEQLLTPKMMLSTSADIALKGAHLAHKLAIELDWKYKIHTHSQSFKSRQEKLEKAEPEASDNTPIQGGASDAASTSEGSPDEQASGPDADTSGTLAI